MPGRPVAFAVWLSLGVGALGLARPAGAAWTAFAPLGTAAMVSDLSCVVPTAGTVVCGALNSQQFVSFAHYVNGAWSDWRPVLAASLTPPSCAAASARTVVCGSIKTVAGKPTQGVLGLDIWGSVGFTNADTLTFADVLPSAPGCTPSASGQAFCVVATASTTMQAASFAASSSTAAYVGQAQYEYAWSKVSCAYSSAGFPICAWLGRNSHVNVRNSFPINSIAPGIEQGDTFDLGGPPASLPQCINAGVAARVGCFIVTTTGTLALNEYSGSNWASKNWNGWRGTPDGLVEGFGCAAFASATGASSYICGAVALSDHTLYWTQWNGTQFSGWVSLGGAFIGNPSCVTLNGAAASLRVMCVTRGPDLVPRYTIGP